MPSFAPHLISHGIVPSSCVANAIALTPAATYTPATKLAGSKNENIASIVGKTMAQRCLVHGYEQLRQQHTAYPAPHQAKRPSGLSKAFNKFTPASDAAMQIAKAGNLRSQARVQLQQVTKHGLYASTG